MLQVLVELNDFTGEFAAEKTLIFLTSYLKVGMVALSYRLREPAGMCGHDFRQTMRTKTRK